MPSSTPLGRALGELVIIVLGVLIALAAQAWWEGRQLAEDRVRALAAIAADLELVIENLEDELARVDSVETSIRWILDPGTEFLPADQATYSRHTRMALWEISGVELGLPAFEDLKGSGRLGLLPDTVRSDLARMEDATRLLDQLSDDNFQYQIRNLDPWLLDNAPLRSILEYDQDLGRDFERFPPGTLRSRRVENMLLAKLELVSNLRSVLQGTHALAVRLLGAGGKPGSVGPP